MHREFQITYRHSADVLHIRLNGKFTDTCAWKLFKLLRKNGDSRKVFVNTHDVAEITDEGVALFKTHMIRKLLPREGLYFKGENGFKMGPDGSRVLIYRKRNGAEPECNKRPKCRFRCMSGGKKDARNAGGAE